MSNHQSPQEIEVFRDDEGVTSIDQKRLIPHKVLDDVVGCGITNSINAIAAELEEQLLRMSDHVVGGLNPQI